MAHILEILSWKYNRAQGIRMIDNVIIDWPQSLGPVPTQNEINQYAVEYNNHITALAQIEAAKQTAKVQAIIDNLPSWAQVEAAIDAAFTGAQRNVIKKLARVLYWSVKNEEN